VLVLDDDDLVAAVCSVTPDPTCRKRYVLEDVLRRNIHALASLESLRAPLRFAYSVKANPARDVLDLVSAAGLYAEVIGPDELELALECGFGLRTIHNGPLPAWKHHAAPGIVFSDSVEAFANNCRRLEGTLVGIRFRPRGIPSRFGIGEEQLGELCATIRASGRRTIGVSLHVRPEDYGNFTWRQLVASALEFAREIESRCGIRVTAFDVGGGKTPVDFDRALAAGDFAWLLRETLAALPYAHAVFSEPGEAIVTPCAFVVAPVLEIRRDGGRTDVVVDAAYTDLLQISAFAHRVLAIVDGTPHLLPAGNDRILGCSCLEYDVIRSDVRLPERLDRLRAIVVADAGLCDADSRAAHRIGLDLSDV
jgi:diaminopimelate decarboxylase